MKYHMKNSAQGYSCDKISLVMVNSTRLYVIEDNFVPSCLLMSATLRSFNR